MCFRQRDVGLLHRRDGCRDVANFAFSATAGEDYAENAENGDGKKNFSEHENLLKRGIKPGLLQRGNRRCHVIIDFAFDTAAGQNRAEHAEKSDGKKNLTHGNLLLGAN